ncbi:hypothetical protein B484DRAFT_405395, partial [Ochromonadaceae sp. CCMP2298]
GATHTIAQLALVNEQLQDSIVGGPLRTVTSMLVDPQNDRDIRAAAEDVVRNLGFLGGLKDFELCGYDFEILRDWYVMKRALKPQDMAQQILCDWVHNLFNDDSRSLSVFQLRHQSSESLLSANELAFEAESILHSSHMVPPPERQVTALNNASGGRLQPLSIPQLHRNFTESILRYLPLCIKSPFESRARSEDDDSNDTTHAHFMNRSLTPALNPGLDETYDWLDRPPMGIVKLLDIFYTSKLHQLLLMDLTSLGVAISPALGAPGSPGAPVPGDEASDYDVVYVLPRPHPVSAITLPTRTYQSFVRVGRVVERMVEYSDPAKMWALIFRDSGYMGDFHTSLLSTLRKCPQICSLSFASAQRVEEDALLGHLVGQIPPSVRFLSFKSTLSRESIQALCILLRTHNAAFGDPDQDPRPLRVYRGASASLGEGFDDQAEVKGAPKGLVGLALTHLTFDSTEISYLVDLLQRATRVTRHASFRQQLKERHSVSSGMAEANSPSEGRTRGRSRSDGTPLSVPGTPPTPPAALLGGLRFLDLSHNALSDGNAARVLAAALVGPLEGLELAGNAIFRGVKFAETMETMQGEGDKRRLRYLGLSRNALSSKTVAAFLARLAHTSLTALDLSENEIDHTPASNEMLRAFVRSNTCLRSLDLCHNRLNAESFKHVHLGLLENESLLLLPMAGNQDVISSRTVSLIQIKLRENRQVYKAQTGEDESGAFQKMETESDPGSESDGSVALVKEELEGLEALEELEELGPNQGDLEG